MSIKQLTITMAAAALFAVVGSASGSAQENCGVMHQHVTQAYQMHSPRYGEMLNHYNARCLSGSGDRHHRYDNDRRGYDNDRRGHDYERGNRG